MATVRSTTASEPGTSLLNKDKLLLLPGIEEPLSLDRLAGSWFIYQLARGHRFSADDLLTAWVAAKEAPASGGKQLDLGAGIGSVGLLTQWRLGAFEAQSWRLSMLEAQAISHQLACATIAHNRLKAHIDARLGDLREADLKPEFALVTGSPPYIPLGKGLASKHPQKAACRMELRGSIADYALAAARALSPVGVFVVCFAGQDPRGEQALAAAGLFLHRRVDVYFRAKLPPTICILVARRQMSAVQQERFTIRDQNGVWTEEYLKMRLEMGADPASLQMGG
jgi:tRNA1(Val) A37 N6-methylase TrmN6